MKKFYLIISLLLISKIVFAQGFYAGLDLGYLAPSQKDLFGYSINEATGEEKELKNSLGEGQVYSLSGGYMFSKYVGAELAVNLLQNNGFESNAQSGGAIVFNQITEGKPQVRVVPTLVLSTGRETFNVYSKLGVIVPFNNKFLIDGGEEEVLITNKISLGLSSVLGLSYQISEKIDIHGEFRYVLMGMKPKKAKIIKSDQDPSLVGEEIELTGDDLDEDSFGKSISYSGIGFAIGMHYRF